MLLEGGFTGVDSHGHHWQGGHQVKAQPDAGQVAGDPALPDPATLDAQAESRLAQIWHAISSLPGKAIPPRVKAAVAKVKDYAVKKLVDRYGERGASIILKVAALSAPIPLPGSQPAAIALSLVIAEGVRFFRKRPEPAVHESAEHPGQPDLTPAEIQAAVTELLTDLQRKLQEELTQPTGTNVAQESRELRKSGFTGIDRHGHQWEDGHQVKRRDEAENPNLAHLDPHKKEFIRGMGGASAWRLEKDELTHGLNTHIDSADKVEADLAGSGVYDDPVIDRLQDAVFQAQPAQGERHLKDYRKGFLKIAAAAEKALEHYRFRELEPGSDEERDRPAVLTAIRKTLLYARKGLEHFAALQAHQEKGKDLRAKGRPAQESVEVRTRGELRVLMEAGFTGQITTKSGQIWYYQDGKRVPNPNAPQKPVKAPRAAAAPAAPKAAKVSPADKLAAKQKAAADKAAAKKGEADRKEAEKQAAAAAKEKVKTDAFAAAKEIASGKPATPEQLGHLGQAVLSMTLKDLQALKKSLGAAGNAGTKAGAVKAIKDQAAKAAVAKPAAAAQPAAKQPAFTPAHHQAAVNIIHRLAGEHGLADMVQVRAALAKGGLTDRGHQDALINDLRKKGVLTAAPYEGRNGISPEQQSAQLPEPGKQPGQPDMGLVSLRADSPLKPAAAAAKPHVAAVKGLKAEMDKAGADMNKSGARSSVDPESWRPHFDRATKDLSREDAVALAHEMGANTVPKGASKSEALKRAWLKATEELYAWNSIQV